MLDRMPVFEIGNFEGCCSKKMMMMINTGEKFCTILYIYIYSLLCMLYSVWYFLQLKTIRMQRLFLCASLFIYIDIVIDIVIVRSSCCPILCLRNLPMTARSGWWRERKKEKLTHHARQIIFGQPVLWRRWSTVYIESISLEEKQSFGKHHVDLVELIYTCFRVHPLGVVITWQHACCLLACLQEAPC